MKTANAVPLLVTLLALTGCEERAAPTYNISPSPHIVTLNDDNFSEVVRQSQTPVLVDFYADWCGPCRALEPALNAVEHGYHGKLTVARINVDDNPRTAADYAVSGIPLLLLFNNGKIVAQQEGLPEDDGSGDLVQAQLTAVAKMLNSIAAPQPQR